MWPSKTVSPYRSDSSPPKWVHTQSRQIAARSRGATVSVLITEDGVMGLRRVAGKEIMCPGVALCERWH
ncbi:hypothetical protein Y695_01733 [Hydrogenophaga sp. T4]|nr:hypothetical protein Y695_01733 [Hydrogenophaga sp. T4]